METETLKKQKTEAVPKLRFREFEEEWRTHKIGSFVKERSMIAQSGLPLYSLTIEKGVIPKSKRYERSFLVKGKANAYKLMLQEDFAFNPMNLRFGALAKYKGKDQIAVSKYYNIFYCLDKCNSAFMEYYLTRYNMIQYYNKMSTGTLEEKKRVHYSDFVNFKKSFPSLPEQQKIASFLSAVDKKIQQLTRKKELLETYKKGVMQQLFSQEIRFQDEEGKDFAEWQTKQLKDFCSFFSGGTPTSTNKKFYTGKIPFIGSGNIYDTKVPNFITEEALKASSAKLVEKGDILYALYGANSGEVAISKLSGAINQAILCIRTKASTPYLYYLLSYNQQRIITKYLQGGQGNLSASIIKNLKYRFPSKKEQQKIADFLSAIDKKIEAVSQQISQTQSFKKGLLQQMFV